MGTLIKVGRPEAPIKPSVAQVLCRVRSDPKDILQADPALWTFCGLCVGSLNYLAVWGSLGVQSASWLPTLLSWMVPFSTQGSLSIRHCRGLALHLSSRLAHIKSLPGRGLNSSAHSQTKMPLSLEAFPSPCDQAQGLCAAVCCFPAPTLTSAVASLLMSHAQCLRLPWFTLSRIQQSFGYLSF